MSKKVIERVQKLLSLAGNNPSQEEAESALLKAQEYLAKHGLSLSDVMASNEDREVVRLDATPFKRLTWYEKSLASIVAEHFKCKTYLGSAHRATRVMFMGYESDAQVAKEVYVFALSALRHHSIEFGAKKNRDGFGRSIVNGLKNTFIKGFIAGLDAKLEQNSEENGWGLVLVVDAVVMQKFETAIAGGRMSRSSYTTRTSDEAYNSGYERGNKLEHDRR